MTDALNEEAAARIDWQTIEQERKKRLILDLNLDALLPRILPSGWREYGPRSEDGAMYVHRGLRLSLIISFARESDGRRWAHLSIANPDRIPAWEWLKEAKELFLGDRTAIMVFPPRAQWINIHKNCLHLWACLDDHGLPNFSAGNSI